MYGFKITSTIETKDETNDIKIGGVLYESDIDDRRATAAAAEAWAQQILNGLDGSRAYNTARDTAEIVTYKI